MEDREKQEQRLKVYTGRTNPALHSSSREGDTQDFTRDETTVRQSNPEIRTTDRETREFQTHAEGSALVTDPYASFEDQEQNFHETMQEQPDTGNIFKDVKFQSRSSPEQMKRTVSQARDKSMEFVQSTEKSGDNNDFKDSHDLQYSYEETDSRPPTGLQEQHPLSVYFDGRQQNETQHEMQIQENQLQGRDQLSEASFGRSYDHMPQQIHDQSTDIKKQQTFGGPYDYYPNQEQLAQMEQQMDQQRLDMIMGSQESRQSSPVATELTDSYFRQSQLDYDRSDPRHKTTLSPTIQQRFSDDDKQMALHESQAHNSGPNSSIYGSIEDRDGQRFNQFKTINDHSKSKSLESAKGIQASNSQIIQMNPNQQMHMTAPSQQPNHEQTDSSGNQYSNPVDNYQFLQGIREVDDDSDTLGGRSGAKSSSGPAGASVKEFQYQDSFKSSKHNSFGKNRDMYQNLYQQEPEQQQHPYSGSGEFDMKSQSQAQSSEQQMSFGGQPSKNEIIPQPTQPPTQYIEQNQMQQDDNINYRNQLSSFYDQNQNAYDNSQASERSLLANRSFALMGEKACMRMVLKEMSTVLEDLSSRMCQQTVQQEIIMNEETPLSQMRQIMDLQLQEQKSSANALKDNLHHSDSDDILNDRQKQISDKNKRKSNLQLVEQIRMDSKMMQIRFDDFLTRESNVYIMLAKEKEKNQMLQEELLRYEDEGALVPASAEVVMSRKQTFDKPSDQVSANGQSNFSNFDRYQPKSQQKDPAENDSFQYSNSQQMKNNRRQSTLTMEQLSPGSPFQGNIAQLNDFQMQIQDQDPSDLIQRLDEKETQLSQINEYVNNIKNEFQLYKDQSERILTDSGRDLADIVQDSNIGVFQKQQDKLVELHTQVYNLKRQNTFLADQLEPNQVKYSASPDSRRRPEIMVYDGIEQLNKGNGLDAQLINSKSWRNLNSTSSKGDRSNLDSSPINVQSKQQSLLVPYDHESGPIMVNTAHLGSIGTEPNPIQSATIPRRQPSSFTQPTQSIRIAGNNLETPVTIPEDRTSLNTRFIHQLSQRIGEHQSQMSSNDNLQEMRNLKLVIELLDKKLGEETQMNKILNDKLNHKENQYTELRVLTNDLKAQADINSAALDKAGSVIKKLNEDTERNVELMNQVKEQNDQLKNDNRQKKQMVEQMDNLVKTKEEGCDQKIQQIDNDLNLEIKDLKEALKQYQNEKEEEKRSMQSHISELQEKLNVSYSNQQAMEKRMNDDEKNMHLEVTKKHNELLALHDQNLSLKIQLQKLQQQIEADIDVKDDLNYRNNMFLKNQINELKLKLNAHQNQTRYFPNQNPQVKVLDQDGEELPKINASYLTTLADEFNKVSKELTISQKLLNEKSSETLSSFLHKHIPIFEDFKVRVLDNLVDWHQKSTELSKLANKYYDTLEEYKMLFVQMKQLIKQKDAMVKNLQNHASNQRAMHVSREEQVHYQLVDTSQSTLLDLKKMTRVLELKLRVKQGDCDELIRYQDEFRQEYIKTSTERDALLRDFDGLRGKLQCLETDLDAQKKADFDFRDSLRNLLDIQQGPHCLEIIPQHIESLLETNRTLKAQVSHYQEKSNELSSQLEEQRTTFQRKMEEMQNQLESSQRDYLNKQEETQDQFAIKEHQFEQKISELTSQVDKANQELQMRERQIRKHDSKLEAEETKYTELHKEIQTRKEEIIKANEAKDAVKDTYDLLEDKLRNTEALLDQRNNQVDRQDTQLKEVYNRLDKLGVDLEKVNEQLQERNKNIVNLNMELHEAQQSQMFSSTDLRNLREQNSILSSDNNVRKTDLDKLQFERMENVNKINEMEKKAIENENLLRIQEGELMKYQDSMTFLSRSLDEQKLNDLDVKILKQEKMKLEEIIQSNDIEIAHLLARYVNVPKQEISTQTDDFGMAQFQMLNQELMNQSIQLQQYDDQCNQLKQAMQRQINDIDRLIDEKRSLEREIEQKSELISQFKSGAGKERSAKESMMSENVNLQNVGSRNRSNSRNNDSTGVGNSASLNFFDYKKNSDLIQKEQERYISKLEAELNDMRHENEKLKDKLIMYELQNLEHGAPANHFSNSGAKTWKSSNLYNANTMHSNNLMNFNERGLDDSNINNTQVFSNKGNYTQQVGTLHAVNSGVSSIEKSMNPPVYQQSYNTAQDHQKPQQILYANRNQFNQSLNLEDNSLQQTHQKNNFLRTEVNMPTQARFMHQRYSSQDRTTSPLRSKSPTVRKMQNNEQFYTLNKSQTSDGTNSRVQQQYLDQYHGATFEHRTSIRTSSPPTSQKPGGCPGGTFQPQIIEQHHYQSRFAQESINQRGSSPYDSVPSQDAGVSLLGQGMLQPNQYSAATLGPQGGQRSAQKEPQQEHAINGSFEQYPLLQKYNPPLNIHQ